MKQDIIVAGVGGQGILTIARALSMAAMAKGWHVKQAEVHGMSQRGGAVYSHLRISDQEIFSDMIPVGAADLVLAIEPLEALRYAHMLRPGGTIVASTNAVVNIPDYPPIENVLAHIAEYPGHIAIDMERLARAAGGVLASNIVALGAASTVLDFTFRDLQDSVEALFESKGERVVQVNERALRFGRTAAIAYHEAVDRAVAPQHARGWIATLDDTHLASEEDLDFSGLETLFDENVLTGAEAHAFESLLMNAYEEGRRQLFEHEVYRLIELVGAISPPRHTFVAKGQTLSEEALLHYPGEKVVLKLVSPDVVHKTEAGAVMIVPKDLARIRAAIDQMITRHTQHASVEGILVVEFVEHESHGLGRELFVGIRATREFGPVIAAGLGGVQTEYLAAKMRPGIAVAKAPVSDVSAEDFLEMFRQTAAYDVLAGRIRGHERTVSDHELLRCFRAFISIARSFCIDRGATGPDIGELEVNPFAFAGQRLVPLDGRGQLRTAAQARAARPKANVDALLRPRTIGLIGVSSNPDSLSRVILKNVRASGFADQNLRVIKPDLSDFEGLKCVPTIQDLDVDLDLLVVTVPASALPEVVGQCVDSGKVRSSILISGGAGETDGTEELAAEIMAHIERSRGKEGGPVFVGPNCMGVRSIPGSYDTFFIPDAKLPPRRETKAQPVAMISQSGAFIVSRLSSHARFQPKYAISIGNQFDLTVSDLLGSLLDAPDLQVAAVYLEGFADLDGIESMRAVQRWTDAGKTVVFYKAGRTESGRSAAAGHTAAVAGDYDICQTAMRNAGAIVAQDFREFGLALELATSLSERTASGKCVFAVTNAGMEAVAMADSGINLAPMSETFEADIAQVLANHRLDSLVAPRNPLDVTPQASERAYDDIVRAALARDDVDALIVSCVPLAPTLHTLDSELAHPDSFASRAGSWLEISRKPIVFAIDGGSEFEPLAEALRGLGFMVFRSADEAARTLHQWLENRLRSAVAPEPELAPA